MIRFEEMRQQHDAAEEIAASIVAKMAAYRDEFDAIPIAGLLAKLNALLRIHLAYEDSILYPALMCSGDHELASLAGKFRDELGTLAEQFEDFVRRWSGPTVIAVSFDRFREEATELFALLGARIERENDQLYPLAERLKMAEPISRAA